jgi:hypothetical protein
MKMFSLRTGKEHNVSSHEVIFICCCPEMSMNIFFVLDNPTYVDWQLWQEGFHLEACLPAHHCKPRHLSHQMWQALCQGQGMPTAMALSIVQIL